MSDSVPAFLGVAFEVFSLSSARTPKNLEAKDRGIGVAIVAVCRTGSAAWHTRVCHGEHLWIRFSNRQVRAGVFQSVWNSSLLTGVNIVIVRHLKALHVFLRPWVKVEARVGKIGVWHLQKKKTQNKWKLSGRVPETLAKLESHNLDVLWVKPSALRMSLVHSTCKMWNYPGWVTNSWLGKSFSYQ